MSDQKDKINLYIHCRQCSIDKPKNKSMNDWSRIEVGRTDYGILIRCKRHKIEIVHLPYDWNDDMKPCSCDKCKEKFGG